MTLVEEIRSIIEKSRANAARSVYFCRVRMYWHIGQRIVEEEQGGKARAEYGQYVIRNLSKELIPEYGSGFTTRQLERARQFYLEYLIASAVRTQFNWTQYNLLIAIADTDKRKYYELEAANNKWTARELDRSDVSDVSPYGGTTDIGDRESQIADKPRDETMGCITHKISVTLQFNKNNRERISI